MAIPKRYRARARLGSVAVAVGCCVLLCANAVSPLLSYRTGTLSDIMLNVLIARHAQSEWNQLGRWQGRADPQLSEFGNLQAADAALRCGAFDAIVSSNLARACQTAMVIAQATGVGPVLIDDAFCERDVGEYQGLTRSEIDAQFPGQLEAGIWPKGWETDEAVLQRVQNALEGLRRQWQAGDVLVVAHGGIIYTLERHFGNDFNRISNLEGRWLHHDGTSWYLGERVALTQQLKPENQEQIL